MTRIEILGVLLILAVSIAVLLVSIVRNRQLMWVPACHRNLVMIERGVLTYAEEHGERWPLAAHPEATEERRGKVDYTQAIGSYRGRAGNSDAGNTALMDPLPTRLSTTRSLWMLFRGGHVRREQFVCPGTQDRPNDEANAMDYWDFGSGDITGSATPAQSRAGYSQVSYGYQVPYGKHGRPTLDWDRNPWIADKGPFGAVIEARRPAPPEAPNTLPINDKDWRPWNSPNHRGEGQNVVLPNLSIEFHRTPEAGPLGHLESNIYTRADPPGEESSSASFSLLGTPPTVGGRETPADDTDSLIYP